MELKFPARFFALSAAALAVAAACFLPACSGSSEIPSMRVAYSPSDHHAALYAAALSPERFIENGGLYLKEKTFKKEYDLMEGGRVVAHVELEPVEEGAETVRGLGEALFDFAFASFPEMVKGIDMGEPVRVMAPLMAGRTGLVVRGEMCASDWKGFVIQARANARPLRIGYREEGVQQLALEEALLREGLPSGKELKNPRVITVNLYGQKNLIPALKAGVIDGFVGSQPLLAEAVSSAAGKLIAYIDDYEKEGGGGYFPCCCLGAREGFVKNHPEAAEKFLTLILRANRYVYENPKEAAPKVAKWLGQPVEVEELSLPAIKYETGLGGDWKEGAGEWLRLAASRNEIVGEARKAWVKGDPWERIFDLDMLEKATKKL